MFSAADPRAEIAALRALCTERRMTARQQWSVVAIVVLVLGGALFAASHLLGDELYPVSVGSKAPPFTAATVDSVPRTKTLADYKGQVVLLNIWATFCVPCRDEMPASRSCTRRWRRRGSRSSP